MWIPCPLSGEVGSVALTGAVEAGPAPLAAIGAAIAGWDGLRHATELIDEREERRAWWWAVAAGGLLLLAGLLAAPAVLFFPNDTIAGAADLLLRGRRPRRRVLAPIPGRPLRPSRLHVVPGLSLTTAQVEAAARLVEASLDSEAAVHGVLLPAVTDPERYHPRFAP